MKSSFLLLVLLAINACNSEKPLTAISESITHSEAEISGCAGRQKGLFQQSELNLLDSLGSLLDVLLSKSPKAFSYPICTKL